MKIVVVEDQTMVREMLAQACAQAVPKAEVLVASDCASALEQCKTHRPDLVILDLELPDGEGLTILPEIFKSTPLAKVIALSSHTDELTLHRAMQARVHGFVDKKEGPLRVIAEAITAVMAGKQFQSPLVQRVRASMRADPEAFNKVLSEREQEVLGLIGLGYSNEEIGDLLGLSGNTVKNHRRSIMGKIGIHGTPQLIRYATDKGFAWTARQTHKLA
jgi:DNA-binding NarL/FixJ family response regulator